MYPNKSGRQKNTVFDSSIGRSMTLKQYGKHIKDQTMSKSEVVKRRLLTKVELEKAINENKVAVFKIGSSIRITKISLQEYFSL